MCQERKWIPVVLGSPNLLYEEVVTPTKNSHPTVSGSVAGRSASSCLQFLPWPLKHLSKGLAYPNIIACTDIIQNMCKMYTTITKKCLSLLLGCRTGQKKTQTTPRYWNFMWTGNVRGCCCYVVFVVVVLHSWPDSVCLFLLNMFTDFSRSRTKFLSFSREVFDR